MRDQDITFLIDYVAKHTGIQLDASKGYLLKSRLNDVVRKHNLDSLDDLCQRLRGIGQRTLLPDIVDAMTTNETSFFRDGLPFKQLADTVLPELIRLRQGSRRLRIWSAACSSGQEAVTLGIVLAESFPELDSWDVKILASDVSQAMVDRCASATFTDNEVGRGMPLALRGRYFDQVEDGWQAKASIRQRMEVSQINLIRPLPPMGPVDLVLLRNVLIYFDDDTRESIFRGISRVMAADGYLLLGTAEKPRCGNFERAFGPQANVFQLGGRSTHSSPSNPRPRKTGS